MSENFLGLLRRLVTERALLFLSNIRDPARYHGDVMSPYGAQRRVV
jgi:hypothetical protein